MSQRCELIDNSSLSEIVLFLSYQRDFFLNTKIVQAEIIPSVDQLLAAAEIQVYTLCVCVCVWPKDSKVKLGTCLKSFVQPLLLMPLGYNVRNYNMSKHECFCFGFLW